MLGHSTYKHAEYSCCWNILIMGTILVIYKPRDSINVLFLPPRSPFGFFCLLFQIFLLRQFIEVIGNHVNLRKDKDKHRILNRMEEKILRRFEKLDTLEHRFTARVASLVFSSIWYDLLSRWYFGQDAIMCSIQFVVVTVVSVTRWLVVSLPKSFILSF